MRLVLDASVAIKFYVPEPDPERALSWLRREIRFAVPDIFLVEVSQALLRHVREHRLARRDLALAVRDLVAMVEVPFASAAVIERAIGIAEAHQHRLHDCMYLAVAEKLRCPLLTADERLARKFQPGTLAIPLLSLADAPP